MTETTINHSAEEPLHFGHLKAVLLAAIVLLATSWMKDPQLSSVFKNHRVSAVVNSTEVPHYYTYVPPPEYAQPLVAGANTAPAGPSIINEDGSITPALDAGQVLGAATSDVQLSLDDIAVKEIPDSDAAIKQYLTEAQKVESGYIDNADFESALSSGNQQQIDQQGQKLSAIKNNLADLPVPHSLVKLQKLKIVQYGAGINILKIFTKANDNPELVGKYLEQFLKAQQDLDAENMSIQQKYNINLNSTAAGTNF